MPTDRHTLVARTIRATFEESALRGERILAPARAVFCVAIGLRFHALTVACAVPQAPARSIMTYVALALGVLISLATYLPIWRRRVPLWLQLSVIVDAAVCFGALLPNAIWPGPGYPGVTSTGDATILVMVVMVAGLRHAPSAAAVGAVLNSASYVALVWAEVHFGGLAAWPADDRYVLCGIYIAAASMVAVTWAVAARRLALRGARAAVDADIAGRSLAELLHGHHDVRAVLGAARLHADLLAREVAEHAPAAALASTSSELRADLSALENLVDDIKVRTYEELLAMERPVSVDLAEVMGEITALVAGRYPQVAFSTELDGRPFVLLAGGQAGLRRALLNVVVNACEGDGERRARTVDLRSTTEGQRVRITVVDDGPGFADAALAAGRPPSTKSWGTGLGLGLAAAVARASGGELILGNNDVGGGRVLIELDSASGPAPQELTSRHS